MFAVILSGISTALTPPAAGPGNVLAANNIVQNKLNGAINLTDWDVALAKLNFANTMYNVLPQYGNTLYSLTIGGRSYNNITMPNGFYSPLQLGEAINAFQLANDLVLIDENGNYYYYISIVYDFVQATGQITFTALPTTLPDGWQNPSGLTLNGQTPTLTFPPPVINGYGGLGSIIGFAPGTYPSNTSATVVVNGTQYPTQPVQFINVTTTFTTNVTLASFPFSIHTFIPTTPFGQIIDEVPNQYQFFSCTGGPANYYNTLIIQLTDQIGNPIPLTTNNIVVILWFRSRRYHG